jgi:hypothetical protein
MMNISKQFDEQQEVKHLQSRISLFINGFQVGAMLNLSGIRKLRGRLAACFVSGNLSAAF